MMRRFHDRVPATNVSMEKQGYSVKDLEDATSLVAKPTGVHRPRHSLRRPVYVGFAMLSFGVLVFLFLPWQLSLRRTTSVARLRPDDCNSIEAGYLCNIPTSRLWGQYSPYYAVRPEHSNEPPKGCHITFVQMLSRHGARFPTYQKSAAYKDLVSRIQQDVKSFRGQYGFLKAYSYDLGADDLIEFGRQEMIDSGKQFFSRYQNVVSKRPMFVRASGQDRVVESAQLFVKGYNDAQVSEDRGTNKEHFASRLSPGIVDPNDIVVIAEGPHSNNTLDHSLCTAFESSASQAAAAQLLEFLSPITHRLNKDLPRANLSVTDALFLMDLCPFDSLASAEPRILSPFCNLFSKSEWESYNHFQTLQKYYGYGPGASLGPTQGVGWANELISRLTSTPVIDHTNVNHTLDDNPEAFPLDRSLYADFSHDNDMTSIFSALGLWNSTESLEGFEASEIVPFAARGWVEKMTCDGEEEYVRLIINNKIMELPQCRGSDVHRCTLASFRDSLTFARRGGKWEECYK